MRRLPIGQVLVHFRGELQNYFTKILEDNLKAIIKPQYVDHIPRLLAEKWRILEQKEQRDNRGKIMDELDKSYQGT